MRFRRTWMHFIPLAIDKKTEATTVITFNYMNDTPRKRKQRKAPHRKSVFFPWCVCEKTKKKVAWHFFYPAGKSNWSSFWFVVSKILYGNKQFHCHISDGFAPFIRVVRWVKEIRGSDTDANEESRRLLKGRLSYQICFPCTPSLLFSVAAAMMQEEDGENKNCFIVIQFQLVSSYLFKKISRSS